MNDEFGSSTEKFSNYVEDIFEQSDVKKNPK